jgi:hypothetical protein
MPIKNVSTSTRGLHLLTYHGALFCTTPDGAFVQRPLADTGATPIVLPAEITARRFEEFLAADGKPLCVPITEGALSGFTMTLAANRRTLTLSRDGRFLSAERDVQNIAHDRAKANEWENLMPLTQHDLSVLRGVAENAWVVRSTGAVVAKRTAALRGGFTLRAGDLSVDLRYQTPFEGSALPYRLRLLRDGWRIDELCLLRPLVVMTAFRTPAVVEQMLLSLQSLREIAHFDGNVLLLTDAAPQLLHRRLSGRDAQRTTIITVAASDAVAGAASRYALLDWPDIRRFQPILCVDPDIVFDADITEMLAAIAASDRIAAPVERQSLQRNSPALGMSLLQQDGAQPRLVPGFSTAVLGIPNVLEHRDTLAQIRRVIVNRCDRFGRNEPVWLEQEAANYVAYRTGSVDTHLITRCLRTIDATQAAHVTAGHGLLRFEGPRGSEAVTDAMRCALRALGGNAGDQPVTMISETFCDEEIEGPAL